MSDSQASSIYSDFNSSPYLSNVSNGTNGEKFTRRHDDVESYFTNNSSVTSFSITGNQLGLSNGSENYKVLKFTLTLSKLIISAKYHDKVGSNLYFSILFFQFLSLSLFVIAPLQPLLLS